MVQTSDNLKKIFLTSRGRERRGRESGWICRRGRWRGRRRRRESGEVIAVPVWV